MLELVILSYTYIGRHIIQTSKYELTGFHCVKRRLMVTILRFIRNME